MSRNKQLAVDVAVGLCGAVAVFCFLSIGWTVAAVAVGVSTVVVVLI